MIKSSAWLVLSILIICLLGNVWILWGEVTFWSLLGVKSLTNSRLNFSPIFSSLVETELVWINLLIELFAGPA